MDFIQYESDDETDLSLGQTVENGFHSDNDSNDEDDGYGFRSSIGTKEREQQLFNEHSDPNSYRWVIRHHDLTYIFNSFRSYP